MAILNYFYEKKHSEIILKRFQENIVQLYFSEKYIFFKKKYLFVKWSFLYKNLLFICTIVSPRFQKNSKSIEKCTLSACTNLHVRPCWCLGPFSERILATLKAHEMLHTFQERPTSAQDGPKTPEHGPKGTKKPANGLESAQTWSNIQIEMLYVIFKRYCNSSENAHRRRATNFMFVHSLILTSIKS